MKASNLIASALLAMFVSNVALAEAAGPAPAADKTAQAAPAKSKAKAGHRKHRKACVNKPDGKACKKAKHRAHRKHKKAVKA